MISAWEKFRTVRADSVHYDSLPGILLTHTPLGRVSGPILGLAHRSLRRGSGSENCPSTDAIGVLGRGASLRRSGALSFLDEFITANFRSDDLNVDELRSLIRKCDIRCMGGTGEPLLEIPDLLRYNIVEYLVTNPHPDTIDGEGPSRIYRKPESVGLETRYLPDSVMSVKQEYFPDRSFGTGVLALATAAIELQKSKVFVAGIDFYEAEYATKSRREAYEAKERNLTYEEWLQKHDGQKETVRLLTEFCSDTEFYFLTNASFKPDLENVSVFGPDREVTAEELRLIAGIGG